MRGPVARRKIDWGRAPRPDTTHLPKRPRVYRIYLNQKDLVALPVIFAPLVRLEARREGV
jgi:hypothetical protein